jgi:hypothetical protein
MPSLINRAALEQQETDYNTSMNTTKKTDAQKQLHKFRNQLHTLLIRNPEIRLATDSFGDIVAFIPEGDRPRVHLPTSSSSGVPIPTSGKQELISK